MLGFAMRGRTRTEDPVRTEPHCVVLTNWALGFLGNIGGCVMGATPKEGVVNFDGAIHGYQNLYVADGSNVPANLGVNPSLTITAIAEYIMARIPDKSQRDNN